MPDTEIRLAVKLEGGEEKPLVLAAKPIDLAGEKVGDCSYFEGTADWLKDVKKFSATGKVNCKGKERPIRIEYPRTGTIPTCDASRPESGGQT